MTTRSRAASRWYGAGAPSPQARWPSSPRCRPWVSLLTPQQPVEVGEERSEQQQEFDDESQEFNEESPGERRPRGAFDLARRLPRGADITEPYVVGTTLHLGARRVPIRGATDAALVGVADGGFVLLVERGRDKKSFSSEYVLAARDGSIERIDVSLQSDVQEEAVSPDGRLFTTGGAVLDLRTGERVGTLPADATYINEWTDAGLFYQTAGDATWVRRPGAGARKVADRILAPRSPGGSRSLPPGADASRWWLSRPASRWPAGAARSVPYSSHQAARRSSRRTVTWCQ